MNRFTKSGLRVGAITSVAFAAPAFAQPVNDDCADAVQVFQDTPYAGTTVDSTTETISSTTCSSGDALDTWHLFSPTADGPLLFSLCGSSYDTTISLWDACGGTELACADLSCGLQSETTYVVTSGVDVYVRVSGWTGATGSYTLQITEGPEPPDPGDFSEGPDVVLSDSDSVANFGAVGGIRGYFIQSDTCNVGNQGLEWGFGAEETPVLAANAYRFADGRLMQIGMGWCKTACCAAQSDGCGLGCSPLGGLLGPGCLDVYSAGYNGGFSRLAPRSSINAWSGDVTPAPGGGGDAIFKRLQVAESDLSVSGASYFIEGVYVGRDDAPAGNHYNNSSYKSVNVSGSSFDLIPVGSMNIGMPAIYAWQDMDPTVQIAEVDIPGEGRFAVASKATALRSGYRYDYAIYNMNSDVSCGRFEVPLGADGQASGVGFHDVDYHSGEVYDNTDWSGGVSGGSVVWQSPQTYVQNVNSNAIRWGTMYNFWFESDQAPAPNGVSALLGTFKPHTPGEVDVIVVGPAALEADCPADWNGDGNLNDQDWFDWVNDYFTQTGPQGQFDFNGDGNQNDQDWFDFANAFFAPGPGC